MIAGRFCEMPFEKDRRPARTPYNSACKRYALVAVLFFSVGRRSAEPRVLIHTQGPLAGSTESRPTRAPKALDVSHVRMNIKYETAGSAKALEECTRDPNGGTHGPPPRISRSWRFH